MEKKKLPPEALEFFREQGRKGGKLGAPIRMQKVSPERRSEIAKAAVAAREAKRKKVSKEVSEYMAAISGRGKGGRARAKNLSPERLSEIAKKAAEARWKKK